MSDTAENRVIGDFILFVGLQTRKDILVQISDISYVVPLENEGGIAVKLKNGSDVYACGTIAGIAALLLQREIQRIKDLAA